MTNNSPEQIRLRRDQNTLRIVGTGTIAFGIWSLVKVFGLFFVKRQAIVSEIFEEAHKINPDIAETYKPVIFTMLLAVMLVFLLFDLSARLYVGLSAISVGKGKQRGMLFIIIACVMIVLSMISAITMLTNTGNSVQDNPTRLHDDTTASSLIVELTSMIMLIDMVAASVRVRRAAGRRRKNKD